MKYKISGEDKNLDFFYKWINEKDRILCAILTGSRVSPNPEIDLLSDYDIQLFVNDLEIFTFACNDGMVYWPQKQVDS